MVPVVLQMDVHCYGCGKKIRKALEKIAGVEGMSSSFETNTVVVTGTAKAEELRTRLEIKMRKSVTILSNGVDGPAAPSRRARAPSPSPPTPARPMSPPRYSRLPTSPPRYQPPTSPPNYPAPTFAPDYPPPPPPGRGRGRTTSTTTPTAKPDRWPSSATITPTLAPSSD